MRKQTATLALLLALTTALSLRGEFVDLTVKIPVDRVVANVETWIKEKPQDAQAEYVLGRIHAMAYAYGPELTLWNRNRDRAGGGAEPFGGQLPSFTPYDTVRVARRIPNPATADDLKHLADSITHYRRALELDPKSALYELGLAWMFEETAKVARQLPADFAGITPVKPTEAEKASYDAAIKKLGNADAKIREDATKLLAAAMPKPFAQLTALKDPDPETAARIDSLLKGYWQLHALEHDRKAYALAKEADLSTRGGMKLEDTYVSAEAARRILEIFKSQPQAANGKEPDELAAHIKTIDAKPMAITPVIFAMPGTHAEHVSDLVDNTKRVTFDLAGDTVPREWPWLHDGTALLVWDPGLTGKITSGRQLFGSRTWWIFFRNGYEALSVLDDNRDGKLSGAETHGIAVWIDKNGDAISQPGEVQSLQSAGITSIGITHTKDTDGTLVSEQGIQFRNGQTVKSFDWVTEALPPSDSKSNLPKQ